MAKANPLVKELNAAAEGLLFTSETDAEIEAFAWPGGDGPPTEATVRANAKVKKDTPVQQTTLASLTRTIPEESRDDFKPLLDLLGKRLSAITVFKVGEVNMDVYVVGRTTDGQYAGVKTEVVET